MELTEFTMVFRSWYQMGNVLGRLEVLLADSADLKVGARRELQTMILNYQMYRDGLK